MRVRAERILLLAAAAALMAWAALAQPPAPAAPPPAAGEPARPAPAIATVGPSRIARAEFESRVKSSLEQYRARLGSELPDELRPVAERQLLENLIRRELLKLEAPRRGVAVSDREAEEELKRDAFFQDRGVFDEAKFLALKTGQPQAFENAIRLMRQQIAARRLQETLERDLAPADAQLRADAERSLTRAAVDLLTLRRAEFSGRYREPREDEILDHYRAHRDQFRRPDRARLSIAFISSPELPDSLRADAGATRRWNDRMKAGADSALAAVRGGASLEDATAAFGPPRSNIVVTRGNFPGYWKASERLNELLFAQKAGTVLPEPVPGNPGWMLVRVDEVNPAHVAPLAEIARQIRSELRDRARTQSDDEVLRAVYQARRESLRTTAYRVRYAVADTAQMNPGEPKVADLDRYYRAHLADYSAFDAATATVKVRPLAAVLEDVRLRWRRERRLEVARSTAARLEAAWRKGRRDRKLERGATLVRELGPVPLGALADTGSAGRTLTDSLAARRGALGVGAGPTPRGLIVFHLYETVADYVPTLEQARGLLAAQRDAEREREEERGGRALFEQDPQRFAGGNIVLFTRVLIPKPDLLDVPLTRQEIERYHREHLERYSAPEAMHARHILISPAGPGDEADRRAREQAADLLRRIRDGEDFAGLARRHSEDPATRDQGGDLGSFARGVMLEEFERVAFSLREGEVSDLVKTEVGYHIIECLGREPAVAQPLIWMWGNVGGDAAIEKAEGIAARRADSLFRVAGTPAKMRAAARKLGLQSLSLRQTGGDRRGQPKLIPVLERLETLKPGEMYPGPYELPGFGHAISWVDSILPPAAPRWEEARRRAIDAYRQGAGQRALDAKIAELDSLLGAGWSFDSLAALWGGLQKLAGLEPGRGLPSLRGAGEVDSLVFGNTRPPVLAPGQVSDWLSLPLAMVRFRLEQRTAPDPGELAARLENDRRTALDRKLHAYYEGLKKRYPVRILDPKLREVTLPEPRAN